MVIKLLKLIFGLTCLSAVIFLTFLFGFFGLACAVGVGIVFLWAFD